MIKMLGRVENQSGLWSKVTMHIEILLLKHAKKKINTCTFESLILDFIWKKLSGSRRCDLTDILQRSGDGLWSGGACSKFQNLNPIFQWLVGDNWPITGLKTVDKFIFTRKTMMLCLLAPMMDLWQCLMTSSTLKKIGKPK